MNGERRVRVAYADDLAIVRFKRLEQRIAGAEGEGLRARWEFGHSLLAARNGKGRLPNGYLRDLTQRLGASRAELTYRAQFAQQFSTESELFNAIEQFGSWYAIVREALPKHIVLEVPDEGVPLPEGIHRTVIADPPWQYDNRATRAAAENHYPTLTIAELCELPVAEWADEQAHLYLWTTNGFLREAFDVMDAWGFDYKTTLVWAKPQLGIGNYFRSSTEYVLFGTRGGLRTLDSNQRNWFEAKRGRHSKKRASKTGNVYIEYECRGKPSGILATEAETWVFVLGRSVLVAAPTGVVREIARKAYIAGRVAECTRGSHPTKGVLVSLGALIPWLLDSATP